jgi:hypothetical protein
MGRCEKIQSKEGKASPVARALQFPLPEFFHSFREMKGDFMAFERNNRL